MSHTLSPIIAPQELLSLLQTSSLVLIDARVGADIKERYRDRHLAGALHVDLEKDLAAVPADAANGGRHPLPSPEQFSKVLGALGIRADHHVVVYDDKNGANAAARFWWMLRAIGHQKVQVLDGGIEKAVEAGVPVSDKAVTPQEAPPYPANDWNLPLADINEVEKVARDDHHKVIDVRDAPRYRGETEPIDLIAGHIPGAMNIPFSGNLDEQGLFLSPSVLKQKYEEALGGTPPENVIVHCGSGVTACHTLLAMDHAGMEIPKLYVGSWSEWSRKGKKIGKGNV